MQLEASGSVHFFALPRIKRNEIAKRQIVGIRYAFIPDKANPMLVRVRLHVNDRRIAYKNLVVRFAKKLLLGTQEPVERIAASSIGPHARPAVVPE